MNISTIVFFSLAIVTAAVASDQPIGASALKATKTWRIMPLGNSITEGSNETATYRCYLWKKLKDAGIRFDFVGTRRGSWKWVRPDGGRGASQPCTKCPYPDFDQDHEGHLAWEAHQMVFGAFDPAYNSHAGTIGQWARETRPDMVLMHLGTNDMDRNHGADSAIADLGRVVDTLRSVNPSIIILMAKLIPAFSPAFDTTDVKFRALNDRIPGLAAVKSRSNSPIVVVDMYTGFNRMAYFKDNWLHPNDSGEVFMANRWFGAIDSVVKAINPK